MRVTARTTQGEPQEGCAGGAQHVVDLVGPLLSGQRDVRALDDVHRATHQEPRGHVHAQRVPGNLLADEAVVGLVGIESVDDVVAEAPSAQALSVGLKTIALGKADDIEPMPSPAFSVAGILQHAIQPALPGSGLQVGQERRHLFRSRRHPEHHQIQPPDEGSSIGLGRRRQPALGEARLNEGIHRIGSTGRDFGCGNRRSDHRLEGPVRVRRRHFGRAQGKGPHRSNPQPAPESSARSTHRGFGCLRWIHTLSTPWSPRKPLGWSRCGPWPCA